MFLALTGAEALYADMGHFGRIPIRVDWFGIVLPALVLNYFGLDALVLVHPEALESPFYHLFPSSLLYPITLLATAATAIASQAVISGAFSLSQQAMQLSLLPRLDVHQTSEHEIGQVYVPQINWLLMGKRHWLGDGVPLVGSLSCRLRYCGGRHDAGHHCASCGGRAPAVELERRIYGVVIGFLFVIDLAFFAANVA
jgi:hypothetical protein